MMHPNAARCRQLIASPNTVTMNTPNTVSAMHSCAILSWPALHPLAKPIRLAGTARLYSIPAISQPATVETLVDWMGDLRREIPKTAAGPLADLLVEKAPLGKQAVEDVLADAISAAVEPALAEGEDDA